MLFDLKKYKQNPKTIVVPIKASDKDVELPNQDNKISNGKTKIKYETTNKIIREINELIIFLTFIKIKKYYSCRYDY